MKNYIFIVSIFSVLHATASFSSGHEGHEHGMNVQGTSHTGIKAHNQVVDGIKATFKVETMAEAMKSMGMEMPTGIDETHHVSVEFRDVKSNTLITEGDVRLKVQNPDNNGQVRTLVAMHKHFGADFVMKSKGRYGVMCKFKLKDGKVRQAKFWYEVK